MPQHIPLTHRIPKAYECRLCGARELSRNTQLPNNWTADAKGCMCEKCSFRRRY